MSIKYTNDHEWVRVDGEEAYVGITDFAIEQLGDLVFVEVPEAGREVDQGDEAGVIESVKAASEIYAPVSGTIVEGNEAVADDPSTVSGDANSDGWFFKIKLSDMGQLDTLMEADDYKAYVDGLDD